MKLREYQIEVKEKIRKAWQDHRSVLAVLPTGAGKTVLFASIIKEHNGPAAVIAHRKEIVGQIALALARLGIKHRVVAPLATVGIIRRRQLELYGKSFVDPMAPVGVVSVQTLTAKSGEKYRTWVGKVGLCVFDEGHHYIEKGIWAKAVQALHSSAKLLFVTATPERADGEGLGFVDVMVGGPPTKWLIDNGFLAKFKYYAPKTDLNISGVALTPSGDFNAKALRARVVESHLVGDAVSHYHRLAPGKQAIVFAVDVETATEMAEAFRQAGYTAAALSGKTEQAERDSTIDLFTRGDLQVLVNVDLFDEGFDVPAVEVVLMARPTQSLAKFLQMCGRGLRPLEGKAEAILIDPVRNWERHGMPDWPRQWTYTGKVKGDRATAAPEEKQRVCDNCTQPYLAVFPRCPYCGAEPVYLGRSLPEQVDGDLQELDVEALGAIFLKIKKADEPDDEFMEGQIARGVPGVGLNAGLRRHRAGKERRKVLRELVAWWVGMQEGRELAEIHRRFFLYFSVDIGTAFTLKSRETDELITTIKERFSDSLHNGADERPV